MSKRLVARMEFDRHRRLAWRRSLLGLLSVVLFGGAPMLMMLMTLMMTLMMMAGLEWPGLRPVHGASLEPKAATAPLAAVLIVTSAADGAANAANCPGPNCRLRDAIAASTAGGTIGFDTSGVFATAQTITLSAGELSIDKNLTIEGPGASLLTISGNNSVRVFNIGSIAPAIDVELSGLTISSGRLNGASVQGGGIYMDVSHLSNQQFSYENRG